MDRTRQLLRTYELSKHGYDYERVGTGEYRIYLIVSDDTVEVVGTEAAARCRVKALNGARQ